MATLSFNIDIAEVPKISEILRRFGVTKIEVSEESQNDSAFSETTKSTLARRLKEHHENPESGFELSEARETLMRKYGF